MNETTMSEYIKGFDAGYAYVLAQIERHPHMTMAEILVMLKGDIECSNNMEKTNDAR